MSIFERLRK